MTSVHNLPIAKRISIYLTNLVFNGVLGMALATVVVQFIIPTSVFFKYDTVEPVSVPVDISKDFIKMRSNILANYTNGNFEWNDVLRCNYDMDPEGFFQYVGQSDTGVEISKIKTEPYISPWIYEGSMPRNEALCQMNSTITRHVLDFIPKKQFVQSEIFLVK